MKSLKYILPLFSLLLCNCAFKSNKKVDAVKTSKSMPFSKIDFSKEYEIDDTEFGTETKMLIVNGWRKMSSNSLANHPTGTFPNEGNPNKIKAQKLEYSFTLNPKLSGESKWAREPGVAVNGIKFEPETAERFVCESGEVYRIEAIQNLLDLGLDFNHAHVQPTGAYHYHGVPTELIKKLDNGKDIILVGYAKDGFPIYYSKSGKYKASYVLSKELRTGDICNYTNPHQSMDRVLSNTRPDGTFVSDWIYVEGKGELDECNGIQIDGEYSYFITDEYPYVSRCLKGEFMEKHPPGPPPGQHSHGFKKPKH
tara:strand:- start:115 stop:1044 length:930 start_codon:yes stop_codon:yes gene_type:complete